MDMGVNLGELVKKHRKLPIWITFWVFFFFSTSGKKILKFIELEIGKNFAKKFKAFKYLFLFILIQIDGEKKPNRYKKQSYQTNT